jgi:hypothetical protein
MRSMVDRPMIMIAYGRNDGKTFELRRSKKSGKLRFIITCFDLIPGRHQESGGWELLVSFGDHVGPTFFVSCHTIRSDLGVAHRQKAKAIIRWTGGVVIDRGPNSLAVSQTVHIFGIGGEKADYGFITIVSG